jgi:hypothetical protein
MIHGGVCMFIKNTLKFTVLEDLEEADFEALWIKMTHPDSQEAKTPLLSEHLPPTTR